MSKEKERHFTVITNEKLSDPPAYKRKDFPDKQNPRESLRERSYLSYQSDPLRERFMKFVNNENRFTVEDLLRW